MAWLSVYGPAVDLTAVKVMLDAAAQAAQADHPDDPRTRDQLRVDILTDLAWTILENGHLPQHDCGDGDSTSGGPDADTADTSHEPDQSADSDDAIGDDGAADAAGTSHDGRGEWIGDPDADPATNSTGDSTRDRADTDADTDDGTGGRCGRGGRCGVGGNRAERRRARRMARRRGRAATVNVTVPITTLLGLDRRPAELEGYGPITAEAAGRIAAHGVWRRLLTDPATGAVLDYGTSRYSAPADLLDHVHARDVSCRFPTCSRPARLCQFDHTIPASAPGWTTSDRNGGPLNAGCHNSKTHAGWRLEQPEPGRFVWTAPTGHVYEALTT
jgi:hypothetical protein